MLTMKKNSILNKLFEVVAKGDNFSFFRKFLFKFFDISKQMSIALLFGKGIDGIVISREKVRAENAFVISPKMFFNDISGAMRVNMKENKLFVGEGPEPLRFSIFSPACFVSIDGGRIW